MPGGRQFKKGQSGNPAGCSARRRELKGLRVLSHREVVELATSILDGTLKDLSKIREDKTASVHKIWLASLVIRGLQKQESGIYHQLIDRVCGKPREHAKLEHVGADGGPIRTSSQQTEEEILAEIAALQKRRQGAKT